MSNSVYARTVSVKHLDQFSINQMFSIFIQYYDGADRGVFERDLSKKDDVILVLNKSEKRIVGFSTLTQYKFRCEDGKSRWGLFSGDTIIEKDYWGNNALQIAFAKYCIKFMLSHPFAEKYWLLISKGYKTYMLLSNNFLDYYPNPERDNTLKPLVEDYCEALFPGVYDKTKGILDFGNEYQMLKDGVAEITDNMIRDNDKIKLFSELNPEWQRGTELPCIGKLNLKVASHYFTVKPLKKQQQRFSRRRYATSA